MRALYALRRVGVTREDLARMPRFEQRAIVLGAVADMDAMRGRG